MKFFNLDLHVSVIEDMRKQFEALGHEVESHLLSGHHWALGRERARAGTGDPIHDGHVGYGSVNLATWEGLFHDIPDLKQVRAWQKENPQLAAFDGFIATYPPAFAMLYDAFPGKTIMNIPIRYELPYTVRPDAWKMYNDHLGDMEARGKLVVVANSRYDAAYYEYFTGRKCRYISSTCDYIDKMTPKWTQACGPKLLAFGEHAGGRMAQKQARNVLFVRDVPQLVQYKHAQIAKARGIVWFPYNASIMSFFEHYWMGVPLFVPSKKFLMELFADRLALSSFSWHNNNLGSSTLSRAGTDLPDPHTIEGVEAWMDLYDFYNTEEFPYLIYFNSWDELRELTKTDLGLLDGISQRMIEHNQTRKEANLKAWAGVVG